MTPPPPSGRGVARDDIDDVIGLAEEIAAREARAGRRLSVAEVVAIGEELGLDPRHVRKAVGELEAREAARARAAAARARHRRLLMLGTTLMLAGLVVAGFAARSGLLRRQADAARLRAQVATVLARQAAVEARYRGLPASADRDAELAGSQNRVSIARRRYDEAATRYNARARDLLGGLWTRLFGLPRALPLSNEVERW